MKLYSLVVVIKRESISRYREFLVYVCMADLFFSVGNKLRVLLSLVFENINMFASRNQCDYGNG